MAEPYTLKSFFSPDLVRRLAAEIGRVHATFAREAFVKAACVGLDALELLDRGRHIAAALKEHLPADYPAAVEVLLRSLGPEHASGELRGAGMAPFFYYPHTVFVAEHGLGHFELSLRANYELTKRFSAEGSIRPYIKHDPERTLAVLRRWAADKNPHVRRLVSEGTRLRLPWAMRVPWLDANPRRVLELLELLKDDPASVVRRSVANNLNDLGKIHPELLRRTAAAWLKGADVNRRALVEHALRGAVKRGDRGALALLGFGSKPAVTLANVKFSPPRVTIGGKVRMTFDLCSASARPQELLVDAAVHFIKKSGGASPKVFKLKRITLAPHATRRFETAFSLKVHTTRVPQPGKHAVDLLINGTRIAAGGFVVTAR